jgi:hypothetical protein
VAAAKPSMKQLKNKEAHSGKKAKNRNRLKHWYEAVSIKDQN